MSSTRINTETGVFQEENNVLGFIPVWEDSQNENGNSQRVNPDSGVLEEQVHILGFIPTWQAKN